MAIFEHTELPDDFFSRVHRHMVEGQRFGNDAVADAVLAVLGRPLNGAERSAIVEAAWAGTLSRSLYPDGVPETALAGHR